MYSELTHILHILESFGINDPVANDARTYIRAKLLDSKKPTDNSAMLKCSCEVYNVCDLMGDIAIDQDCPFHGSLLNTSA